MEPTVIGIPRGMLYYRYEALWKTFFTKLGAEVRVSGPTTRRTAGQGAAVTIDEACLSLKLYFGHVRELIGECDTIFIPRVSNFGRNRDMCPRFHAMYDMAKNIFRDSGQKFLTCNIDVLGGESELKAFMSLGHSLGCPVKSTLSAYQAAKKEDRRVWREKLREQKSLLSRSGLKILLAGHDYLIRDDYIGKPVADFLRRNGVLYAEAGVVDREAALRRSAELSPTCRWEFSREIIGGAAMYRDRIDGIIFLSAFPCGPDAMVNELMLRRTGGLPALNLVLDGQSGVAGIETRLESFLDIIRFKRGML